MLTYRIHPPRMSNMCMMPGKHKIIFFFFFVGFLANLALSQAFANDANNDHANFLVLSDIHFDPFIACHNIAPCPFIQKLRHASSNEWPMLFATYDSSQPQYQQDTNYLLLVSTLTAAKKRANEKEARFVLVLGDFLGHDFRDNYRKYTQDSSVSGYRSFVKKTLQF